VHTGLIRGLDFRFRVKAEASAADGESAETAASDEKQQSENHTYKR
jgi:hypothetical protein